MRIGIQPINWNKGGAQQHGRLAGKNRSPKLVEYGVSRPGAEPDYPGSDEANERGQTYPQVPTRLYLSRLGRRLERDIAYRRRDLRRRRRWSDRGYFGSVKLGNIRAERQFYSDRVERALLGAVERGLVEASGSAISALDARPASPSAWRWSRTRKRSIEAKAASLGRSRQGAWR